MSQDTAQIRKVQDKEGTQFFPITHVDAVIDENGDAVSTLLAGKQDTLVSGTNIKTINNESLLGSGNISVSGGGGGTVTSVAMTVPTGLSISGSPITSSGTLAVSLATGYSIPTTSKQDSWDAKGTYSKPSGGIPATDLASAVQTSLGKADTALQSYTETDPVFTASAAAGIATTDISAWNAKLSGVTFNGVSATVTGGVAAITATIPAAPGTLQTNLTTAQTASASEALSGSIKLHKIAKTGTYSDLIGTPTIPTKVSDLTNDAGYTTNTGTVTRVDVGTSQYSPSSGIVSLPAYPTTLPASDVSAWAKAANKPSYTLDEVSDGSTRKLADYLPLAGGTMQGNLFLTSGSSSLYITGSDSAIVTGTSGTDSSHGTSTLGMVYGSTYLRGQGNPIWKKYDSEGNSTNYTIYHSGNFTPGDYLPLSGGTMTGAGSITYTGDDIAVPLVRNVTRTVSGGWARALADLKVDGGSSFSIVGYGSDYTPGSGSNSITYAYLGFNGYNGDNLRIASDSIKWGNNTIWHAGNDGASSGLDADKLDGQEGSYYAAASSLSSYLPLSAGSSYPLTGDLFLTAGKGISATGGVGLLVYHPSDWPGISSTQWGVGTVESQGVIRSTASDLLHYRGGTNYKVWDAANSGNTGASWSAASITSGYYSTNIPGGSKWYRIFEFNRSASGAASAIIKISRSYSNSNNESYIFSVNIAYSGAVSITQLSGVANIQLIRKVRVDHRNSDHCFVDFYYDGTALNGVNISGYGDGTFQAPAEATLVGTAKEFNLITNGLATNGNIVASGTITPGSDTRLKDDQKVIHADSAYSVIEKLNPKTWVWNQLAEGNAGKAGAGLVAQEVKSVLPEAIEVAGDQETGFHSLNYNMIQGYEIAAIKGLIEEVKSLKAEIAELKKQIK